MRALLSLAALLLLITNHGYSYVSWDGYLFTISDGTARLKKGGEVIFVCDRSAVLVINNHLIVESYSGTGIDIPISAATAQAIANEFKRDTENRRRNDRGETYLRPIPVVPKPIDAHGDPISEEPKVFSTGSSKSESRL